jgi:hypothetical protein
MKKIIFILTILCFTVSTQAQTYAEWFRQKATQKKYLLQQIAALQVYASYLAQGYKIAKDGLNTIQDFKKGDFTLHSNHFTALLTVNPKVKKYAKVAAILSLQINIVRQVGSSIKECRNRGQLTGSEFTYLEKVFKTLTDDCSNCLETLSDILLDGKVSMKDNERIAAIDRIYDDMQDNQVFVRAFGEETKGLCIQRENEQNEIIISKRLNDLK